MRLTGHLLLLAKLNAIEQTTMLAQAGIDNSRELYLDIPEFHHALDIFQVEVDQKLAFVDRVRKHVTISN